MKNHRFLPMLLGLLLIVGCSSGGGGGDDRSMDGDGTPDPMQPISPSDSNAVMRSLAVKVGDASGVRRSGNLPPASADPAAPKLTTNAEVSSSNGSTAQVPLSFESNSIITALFLKVVGSDSVFEVDVSGQSAQAKMQEQALSKSMSSFKLSPDQAANFEVSLPSNLEPGSFQIEIGCQNGEGFISERAVTTVQVARVGSGALQFSLSWDSTPDLDLHVVEPNGNRIFFGSPRSDSGGVLDFDDTDGTGPSRVSADAPNAVENIFWESNPPRGQYIVEVDYFSGSVPTNFTVTITRNGQLVDTVSVNNFSGTSSGDLLEVYRLNL